MDFKADHKMILVLFMVVVARVLALLPTWDLILEADAGSLYQAALQLITFEPTVAFPQKMQLSLYTMLYQPSAGWVAPNAAFFILVGSNVVTPKIIDAICNILTLYVVYQMAVMASGRKAGLISLLLLAILPEFLHFSYAMNSYGVLVFWWSLFIYLLFLAREKMRLRLAVLSGVCYFLAFITKEITILSLPFFVLYPIALRTTKDKMPLKLFLLSALFALSATGILLLCRASVYRFVVPLWALESSWIVEFWKTTAMTNFSFYFRSFMLGVPILPIAALSLFSRKIRSAPLPACSFLTGLFVGLVPLINSHVFARYYALAIPGAAVLSALFAEDKIGLLRTRDRFPQGLLTGHNREKLRSIKDNSERALCSLLMILLLSLNSLVIVQSFDNRIYESYSAPWLSAYPLNLVPVARDVKNFYSYRLEGRVLTAPNFARQTLAYGYETIDVNSIRGDEWIVLYTYPSDAAVGRVLAKYRVRYLIVPRDWVTPGGYNYELAKALVSSYGLVGPTWQHSLENSSILRVVHETLMGRYYEVFVPVVYIDATIISARRSGEVALEPSGEYFYTNNAEGRIHLRSYVYFTGTYKILLRLRTDWGCGIVEIRAAGQTVTATSSIPGSSEEVFAGELFLSKGDVEIEIVMHSFGDLTRLEYVKLVYDRQHSLSSSLLVTVSNR